MHNSQLSFHFFPKSKRHFEPFKNFLADIEKVDVFEAWRKAMDIKLVEKYTSVRNTKNLLIRIITLTVWGYNHYLVQNNNVAVTCLHFSPAPERHKYAIVKMLSVLVIVPSIFHTFVVTLEHDIANASMFTLSVPDLTKVLSHSRRSFERKISSSLMTFFWFVPVLCVITLLVGQELRSGPCALHYKGLEC